MKSQYPWSSAQTNVEIYAIPGLWYPGQNIFKIRILGAVSSGCTWGCIKRNWTGWILGIECLLNSKHNYLVRNHVCLVQRMFIFLVWPWLYRCTIPYISGQPNYV